METMPNPDKREVGMRIKQAREQTGLSQAALAKRLGTSTGAVGQWEIGRARPAASRLQSIANVLNVTTAWLTGEIVNDAAPIPARRDEEETGVSIPLDATLAREARRLGVDLSAVVDRHLRQIVAEARQQRWLAENRGALADANAFLERYGLWNEGKRLF